MNSQNFYKEFNLNQNDGIKITAFRSMAKILNDNFKGNFYPVQDLILKFIDDWDNSKVKIEQIIKISEICRSFIYYEEDYHDSKSEDNRALIESFRKNAKMLLSSLRLLIESNIYPEDIMIGESKTKKYMKEIWKEFEIEHYSANKLRMLLNVKFKDKKKVKNSILELVNKEDSDKYKRIYLIGFYFITPMQERIFRILENVGIKLIFVRFYNDRYEKINEIWDKSLFRNRSQQNINLNNRKTNLFGDKLESKKESILDSEKIKIIEYKNNIDLALDEIWNSDRIFFTTDYERAEEALMQFFPEMFDKKSFLNYPVGQYIYELNKMWNEEENSIEFDIESLISCFASGWVYHKKLNLQGKDYVSDLMKLEDYFKNCRSLSDWRKRFSHIVNRKKYTIKNPKKSDSYESIDKVRNDPYNYLSAFNIEKNRVYDIIKLIEVLIESARSLFSNNSTNENIEKRNKINLSEYFKSLEELLYLGQNEVQNVNEKEMLKELLKKIEVARTSKMECFPEDIKMAVSMMLGGDYSDSTDLEILNNVELEEIDLKKSNTYEGKINLFSEIESSLFSKDFRNKTIHLLFSDEKRLPRKSGNYPWPLSKEFIEGIIDNVTVQHEKEFPIIYKLKSVIENSNIQSRYLFSVLLSNEDVELSWISEENKKEISESVYCKILNLDSSEGDNRIENEYDIESISKSISGKRTRKITIYKEDPIDLKIAYELCPYKLIYGYILGDGPYYNSKFHSILAIQRLLLIQKDKGILENNVIGIEDYLTTLQKSRINEFKKVQILGKKDLEKKKDYLRLSMIFLQKSVRTLLDRKLYEYENVEFLNVNLFDNQNDWEDKLDKLCKYCYSQNICRYRVLRIED